MRNKILLLGGIVSFCIFLIIGIVNLKFYGVNWDEPVHFGRGQAILHYYLTGEKNFDLLVGRKSYYQTNAYSYEYFESKFREGGSFIIGGGHPPLSDLFSAVFNYIFFQKIGIVGDIESYHLYSIFLASLLVGYIFYFVGKKYGFVSGFVSAVSIFLYPLFLGEARFNIKDIPETVFYSFTILFFYNGVFNNRPFFIILSALSFSLALGTKLNIIFVLFSLAIWFLLYTLFVVKDEGVIQYVQKRKYILISCIYFPILATCIFFLAWPLLWEEPLERILTVVRYYKDIGINSTFDYRFITVFGLNTYALQWILYTTPIPTLILSFMGIIYAIKSSLKRDDFFAMLILLWFLIPILRVTMPNAGIYGGVRQIMEYIPAMAILSGIGIFPVSNALKKFGLNKKGHYVISLFISFMVLVAYIPTILKVVQIHPNESLYFNSIIGGLRGAREKNLPGWGNSLGSTYKQGIDWFNMHAEENAKLVLVYELASNIPHITLRNDIIFNNQLRSAYKREGEYIIGVTHEGTEKNFHRAYLDRFLEPVYEVTVDSVPVLKIWKNDTRHTKKEYRGKILTTSNIIISKNENTIRFDVKSQKKVVKLSILYPFTACTQPTKGYFETSANGDEWERLYGDFSFFPFAAWAQPRQKDGELAYLFAGEKIQYIQAVVEDTNSCLMKYSISGVLSYIE